MVWVTSLNQKGGDNVNPAMIILVLLLVVALWFLLSFLYKPIGKVLGKTFDRSMELMLDEDNHKDRLVIQLHELLKKKGMTITTVESITGGKLAARIIDPAGASDVIDTAYVTYSDMAKMKFGVDPEILRKYTAVSRECAEDMALKAEISSGADIAISTTGYANFDDDPQHGFAYIGCSIHGVCSVIKCRLFGGDRNKNRDEAVALAIEFAIKELGK